MADVGRRAQEAMPPPAARSAAARRNPVVLDEDEWTEQMEAIIERDFFPDKAKLENKLEWLQVRDLQPPAAWQSTFVAVF